MVLTVLYAVKNRASYTEIGNKKYYISCCDSKFHAWISKVFFCKWLELGILLRTFPGFLYPKLPGTPMSYPNGSAPGSQNPVPLPLLLRTSASAPSHLCLCSFAYSKSTHDHIRVYLYIYIKGTFCKNFQIFSEINLWFV